MRTHIYEATWEEFCDIVFHNKRYIITSTKEAIHEGDILSVQMMDRGVKQEVNCPILFVGKEEQLGSDYKVLSIGRWN